MARTLFLHIGSHKTGTTALQQGLHRNRILLRACGATYVAAPTATHLHSYLGVPDLAAFLPAGLGVLDPDGLATRLAMAETETVLASSENFSFFFQKPAIAALADLLRPQFDTIRIVCYLRRQDRHAVSHHQEGAKPHRQVEGALWGHAPTALPAPSDAHDLYLDYDRRLGLWADVFGDAAMTIRVYDRNLLKNGDIFADFLSVTGLDITGLQAVGDRNTSLGAAQTKVGHLMNGLAIKGATAGTILARLSPEGRLLPSRPEAEAFQSRYTASNHRLNQRFQVSPGADLFNADYTDYPDIAANDWTEDGANAALLATLAQVNDLQPGLAALTADDLRSAAVALQSTAPEAALRLITAAHALRPSGPAIQKLKADLERKRDAAPPTGL